MAFGHNQPRGALLKRLPRWLRIGLIVLAVLLLLALVVPYFLDVDRYRTAIAAAIEEATGRPVSIGKIRARLLPSIGFVLDDFRFGNPPGFPKGHLFTAESVRGNLAVWPLLRREYRLRSVEIVRPRVFLLEDGRGGTNYDLRGGEKKPGTQQREAPGSAAEFSSVRLVDAELVLGRAVQAGGGESEIVTTLRASGITAELEDVAVDARRLREWRVQADLRGVRLELEGLSGPVEFRSGKFQLAEGAVTVDFEADVAEAARVRGSLRVPDVQDVRAEFELTTPLLEVDRLLAPASPGGRPPRPAAAVRQTGPPGSELLAQGRIGASRIRWKNYQAADGQAQVRVFGNRVEVSPVKAGLYGGSVDLTLRMDRGRTPQRFTSSVRVSGVDVASLLAADPATKGKMTGTAELRLDLSGPAEGDFANALAGTGKFAIRDGSFPGFDLTTAMRTLSQLQRVLNLGSPQEAGSGQTTFRVLRGDLNVRQRRVASRQILLDSSQGTVALQGSVGFNGTLDYQGRAELTASAGGGRSPADLVTGAIGQILKQEVGGLSVPFALRGTLDAPKLQPGRGLPRIRSSSPTQQQEDPKKKSILDMLRRP